jgi:hypothetical protein
VIVAPVAKRTAILCRQGGVIIAHAGVNIGHHDTLTGNAEVAPDSVGIDLMNIPADQVARLGRVATIGYGLAGLLGLRQAGGMVRAKQRHIGARAQRLGIRQGTVSQDGVDDPEWVSWQPARRELAA